uniref:Crustacean hyperglycemic hormone form A n=1 Tax=Hemigrapsus sanguineus TaxID=40176 RepID=A0A482KEP4_HEMSA|nr:crustacean hyperglycemic hormone form A [Hemigrapsus sanguineus]
MPGRNVTLTEAAMMAAVVLTLAAALFVSPASSSPVEPLSLRLDLRAQDPEDRKIDNPGLVEGDKRRWHHERIRRSYVDGSCKGLYSRSVWDDLYNVCKECQNLYRISGLGKDCRRGCFASETFTMCLGDLLKPVDKYLTMAVSLRGS